MADVLWQPDPARVEASRMRAFERFAAEHFGAPADSDPATFHRWSVDESDAFWRAVWQFCGVIGDGPGNVVRDGDDIRDCRWFPEARLNFAENLLRRRDHGPGNGNALTPCASIARRMSGLTLGAGFHRF